MSRAKQQQAARKRLAAPPPQIPSAPTVEVEKPAVVVDASENSRAWSHTALKYQQEYEPDQEFIEAAQPSREAWDPTASQQIDPVTGASMPWEIQATLYEVSKDGTSYRLNHVPNKEQFIKRLTESETRWFENKDVPSEFAPKLREAHFISERDKAIEDEAQRLLEGSGFEYGGYQGESVYGSDRESFARTTYGDGIDVNAEFIPLLGGPSSKALYQYNYLDMHRKAFEQYNHNPVAHQLCELQTSFVLGRGVDHTSTNDDADAIWREFVDRTDFYNDLENIATDLWWAGELMLEFYDDTPQKGQTDYRMIDPSTVWDVITDVEDIQKVFYFHQQYSTVYQMYTRGKIETMKYIIRQIPANDVLHVKLNVSKYEKRGRSDLFSVLGWLKRLKDLMNARVIKGQLEAAFVWDVTVNSGDQDVNSAMLNLPDPYKAGSTFIHNKNLELKGISSEMGGKSGGNQGNPDVDALLNLIAVGFGVPKEFIGQNQKGGKSGALTATEPGVKRFERRQRLVENICHMVANRVFQNAIKAGKLKIKDALDDARSVTKLARKSDQLPAREDLQAEMMDKQDTANETAQKMAQQQSDMALQAHKVGMDMSVKQQAHTIGIEKQAVDQQHQQAMAAINKPGAKANINLGMTGTQGPSMGGGAPPMGQPGQAGPPGQAQAQQGQPGQPQQQRQMQSIREAGQSDESDPAPADGQAKAPVSTGTDPQPVDIPKPEPTQSTSLKTQAPNAADDDESDEEVEKAQKARKKQIMESGNYSREFLEFIFPAIAQEDRSAKLKDLALAEAMEWMSKSTCAKMAAKELNVTTYSFEDEWAQIVSEGQLGLSIAHVYTQDNKHVPATAMAQDVQAESAAKQPVPAAQQQVNVPVPPAVQGDKLMPAQPPGGAPGGGSKPPTQPGQSPNSGSTKINQHAAPQTTDPTAKSHGYSAAANNPMANEGAGRIKGAAMKASMRDEIKRQILQEALGPAVQNIREMAASILADRERAQEVLDELDEE